MPVRQDISNWSDKYQHSDHHVDRFVRNMIEYEDRTGHPFPAWRRSPTPDPGHYIGSDMLSWRHRRSESLPVEDFHSPVVLDTNVLNKAHLISSHAVQDADALTAASRRHDQNFLHDISNKLATANQVRPYSRESTPVYIGNRYPAPANHVPIADVRRRTSYAAPVTDYEVQAYISAGPSRPYSRGASVPPVVTGPSVPKWHPPSRGVRGSSIPRGPQPAYSRESLEPYEDVVVGVAHTSLYGDIVIGIPYNKRHMFDAEVTNHTGGNNYKKTYPNFAGSRHSIATNSPHIGPVSVSRSVKPNYRRTSVATPYRNIYDDEDDVISTPSRYKPRKHYDSLEDDLDWPETRPASMSALKGRAQSVQRQLDGISEFQVNSSSVGRPVAAAPSYRASLPPSGASRATLPPSGAYTGGSSGGSSSAAGFPPSGQPRKYTKPPISEARRKVRDLLCKSKNDPRYFED